MPRRALFPFALLLVLSERPFRPIAHCVASSINTAWSLCTCSHLLSPHRSASLLLPIQPPPARAQAAADCAGQQRLGAAGSRRASRGTPPLSKTAAAAAAARHRTHAGPQQAPCLRTKVAAGWSVCVCVCCGTVSCVMLCSKCACRRSTTPLWPSCVCVAAALVAAPVPRAPVCWHARQQAREERTGEALVARVMQHQQQQEASLPRVPRRHTAACSKLACVCRSRGVCSRGTHWQRSSVVLHPPRRQ